MKESIFYFAISFVLQWVWFGVVHPDRGVTLLDMLIFSILFTVMFFLLAGFGGIRRKGEGSNDEAFPLSVDECSLFYYWRRIF